MKKFNKTCISCGKEYTFCTSCEEYDKLPRWRAIYCSENCKNLFHITSDYIEKTITDDEAKERLLECDLSYKDNLHHNIVDVINKLLKKESKEEHVRKVVKQTDKKTKKNDIE